VKMQPVAVSHQQRPATVTAPAGNDSRGAKLGINIG